MPVDSMADVDVDKSKIRGSSARRGNERMHAECKQAAEDDCPRHLMLCVSVAVPICEAAMQRHTGARSF